MNHNIIESGDINYIIIIGIVIVFVSIYCWCNQDMIEGYDARIPNITLTQCGTECTNAMNCVGFGYQPVGGMCYLSRKPIIGRPEESLYGDEYTKLDKRCNKINRIMDDDSINSISLTQNSIYVCADGENNISTQFQYANLGASSLDGVNSTVFDSSDTDRITPTEVNYKVKDITYPKEKRDLDPSYLTDNLLDTDKKKIKVCIHRIR